jgi:hypothetical protein
MGPFEIEQQNKICLINPTIGAIKKWFQIVNKGRTRYLLHAVTIINNFIMLFYSDDISMSDIMKHK